VQFLDANNVETAELSILKILKDHFSGFPRYPKGSICLSVAVKKMTIKFILSRVYT
jgi:hypothetical protein